MATKILLMRLLSYGVLSLLYAASTVLRAKFGDKTVSYFTIQLWQSLKYQVRFESYQRCPMAELVEVLFSNDLQAHVSLAIVEGSLLLLHSRRYTHVSSH